MRLCTPVSPGVYRLLNRYLVSTFIMITAQCYVLILQVAWSTLEGTDGKVQVYRYADGADSLGGTFTLNFGGDSNVSSPIPWNASAASVEFALESLPQVGDVTVIADPDVAEIRSSSAGAWLVEFTTVGQPANIGDLPLLQADGSYLTGTAVGVAVEEVSAGCCAVEVSANGGADYTSTIGVGGENSNKNITVAFRYQDKAVVRKVVPSAGPASGGTPVVLFGTGFDLPSTTSTVLSSSENVDNGFVCVFGARQESPAVRLNSTSVQCTTPSTPLRASAVVSVTVRWPGSVTPSVTTAAFTYYEDVTLSALTPRRGSNTGGYSTLVPVARGSYSVMRVDVTCIIEVRLFSNLTDGYAVREYFVPAAEVSDASSFNGTAKVADEQTLYKEAYVCNMPGLSDFFQGLDAEDWTDHDWKATALVSLSGNSGINLTAPTTFSYFPRPVVLAVHPALGVDGGGTVVTVSGNRFVSPRGGYNEHELLCRFGHATPVHARYISSDAVECTTPRHANEVAIMSIMVEGASVFHSTQEVLLRIPSPLGNDSSAVSSFHAIVDKTSAVSGTWTLSLEERGTLTMNANVTAAEMTVALSELPNVGNVTVTAEHSYSVLDPYAGLAWNETAFTVYFDGRGGHIPTMSANTSGLRVGVSSEEERPTNAEQEFNVWPVLAPQVLVSVVEDGHDGDGVVREVQVLRTNRSELLAEVQTVTLSTASSPTAEVGLQLFNLLLSQCF